MIYLLQDCYEDQEGNFQKILKIGYSSKSFMEGRKSQYDTHNYGYKLLSEREGSLELERYLHKRLQKYHLSLEWFKYDPEVIKIFNEVSEDDISQFKSQEELNEYIRYYILENLIPSVKDISNLYLNGILEELHEKSKEYPEFEYNEDLLRKEILEVFKFVSSKEREYFENLNFDDKETKNLLSNTGLNLPQIVGRQRDRDNPFKNNIVIFYKTMRKSDMLSKKDFDNIQEQRKISSSNILNGFSKLSLAEQKEYIKKLKSDITVSQYSGDFISISKNTNQPVYNSFIEIANERAWEVSQVDYQDKINVTKALENISSKQSDYEGEIDKVVSDFLNNYFNKTGVFKEKMKMYCEFMDQYPGNKELEEYLYYKLKDPKYRKYYSFYGTSGCRALSYEEKKLSLGILETSKDEIISSKIYEKFKVGERYSKKDIKQILSEIYSHLEVSRTPKSTDLEKYFRLERTVITDPQTKKKKEGYKLNQL